MDQPLATMITERARILEATGIDQAGAEIELILCHLLQVERMQLYLDGSGRITDAILAQLDQLVARRATREPLQYILGEAWFYGRRFVVNRSVMIPTPETELLCHLALEFLQEKSSPPQYHPRVLDLGVGSGVIAVTMTCENESVRVVGLDRSPAALAVARTNAVDHRVDSRIDLRHSEFFAAITQTETFELILSNPPYIATRDYDSLPPEVKADPKEALLAGDDGLDAIRVLLRDAPNHLAGDGRIMFEIGYNQAAAVTELTEADERYRSLVIVKDLNDVDRVVILSCD